MKKILFSLVLGAIALTSCNREGDSNMNKPTASSGTITDLDASANEKWVYFSFKTGKTVEVTTPEKDLSWDIAFSRYHIRTNGGTSGTGKGEVAKLEEKDFAKVTEVSSSLSYTKDEIKEAQGRPKPGETTIPITKISLNKLISGDVGTETGWWSYTPPTGQNGAPHFEVTKWVYIVKDANGIPTKVQLTSYNSSTTAKTGFITFQYKTAVNNKF